MRVTIETVPPIAARCLDDPSRVFVSGHTRTRWQCPDHGEYVQEPWIVVKSYEHGAVSLGCPDCKRASMSAKTKARWVARRNAGKGLPKRW